MLRYDVAIDGALSNATVFYDMTSIPGEIALDGLKVDRAGNLYVAGPGGIWIISSAGKHLGTIKGPELAANFAWGDEDGHALYICARHGLYRLRLSVSGGRQKRIVRASGLLVSRGRFQQFKLIDRPNFALANLHVLPYGTAGVVRVSRLGLTKLAS